MEYNNILITSSVEKTISDSVKLAEELNVGIELSRIPEMKEIDSKFSQIKENTIGLLKNFNGLKTMHAMFSDLNPATKDAMIREVVIKRYNQSFEIAKGINAKKVVFHSGHKGMKHRESVAKFVENSIKFWSEYIKKFEDNEITAVLENVIDLSPEPILEIVNEVNSPNLKACLDTGHANICSSEGDVKDWIKAFGKTLSHMHVHNNYKTNDDHSGFMYGNINFIDIFNTLKEENIKPTVVFEMFDKKQLKESLEIYKKLIKT